MSKEFEKNDEVLELLLWRVEKGANWCLRKELLSSAECGDYKFGVGLVWQL